MVTARVVLLDVADQVDVTEPLALLAAELRTDRIDELGHEPIAQLSHVRDYRKEMRTRRQPPFDGNLLPAVAVELPAGLLSGFEPSGVTG